MRHPKVEPEFKDTVLSEFYELALASEYISQGGIEYAKEILEKALGAERANEVISRLTASPQVRPLTLLERLTRSAAEFIQNEHPQTIALIMAYLNPDQAGLILSALPAERQADVARRLATLDRTSPDVLREIEGTLERSPPL